MYARILVPYDASATSEAALREAVGLAKLCSARLRVIHVVDPLTHITGFEIGSTYVTEILPRLLAAGEDILSQACDSIEAEGVVPVERELLQSSGERVSRIVVEQAASFGADLIVMGTHGRRGIDRVLMGSDAEQVARTATVPVLLVRLPA